MGKRADGEAANSLKNALNYSDRSRRGRRGQEEDERRRSSSHETAVKQESILPMANRDDDPWKFSALISAFAQLVLAVLLLLQTIVACLAFQLIKCFGLPQLCSLPHACPQCGLCQCRRVHARPNSASDGAAHVCNCGAESIVRGLDAPERNGLGNRSRSQDWCAFKSVTLVCPECNAAWSFSRRSNSKDGHWEDGSIEGWSTIAIDSSNVEQDVPVQSRSRRVTSPVHKAQGENKNCARHEERLRSINLDHLHEVVKEMQQLQVEKLAVNSRIVEATRGAPSTRSVEGEEDMALVFQGQIGESKRSLSDSQKIPTTILFSESSYCMDEAEECNNANGMSESSQVLTEDAAPKASIIGTTTENCSGEDAILGLKELLQKEWKMRHALCAELEEERNAAEIAANEAMSMISRLQKEKALLQMESAHYQRIAEEKAIYDNQALQLLKEILYKKERENFLLEKKAKSFKTRFLREATKVSKSRKGIDIDPLSSHDEEPMLQLKGNEEASVLEEHQETTSTDSDQYNFESNSNISGVSLAEMSVAESSSAPRAREEQPCKRLKCLPLHEGELRQSTMIASNGAPFRSSEAASCTLKTAMESREGCQDMATQLEQTAGTSVAAINEDETQSILNHLWALEEQLRALGGSDELEPYDLAQASQNLTVSIAMKSDAGESKVADQSYVGSSDMGLSSSPFSVSEDTTVARKEGGSGLMNNELISSEGMLKFCGPNFPHLDEVGNLDVDLAQTSKDMLTVFHDGHKVQVAEQITNHCLHHEEDGLYQLQEHHLGKNYCSRCDVLERANSGAHFQNLLHVLSSNLDPTETHHHIVT